MEKVLWGVVGLGMGMLIILAFGGEEKTYNCELAEISPDYPAEVKEECRELKKAGML